MDLKQFLALLHVDSGPSDKGEYMCRCPAHDDKTASLSVCEKESPKDGKRRIYVCCQTRKCTTADVLAALHLTPKDLVCDPTDQPRAAAAQGEKPVKVWMSYDAAYGYLGKFVCAYRYTDAQGTPLFEVARIETSRDGIPSKTFRQHVLIGAGFTFPLRKAVPDELKNTLYNLPAVKRAIAENAPVYVVEGEKDADTLIALHRCATTQAMGAGKWRNAHSDHLLGADVIVLPDNDETGEEHARRVADALLGKAKRVRVCRLTGITPELKPHGDISDVIAAMGGDAALKALDALVAETPSHERNPESERERAAEYYGKIFGYCVDRGRICQQTQEGPKPLANFVALPVAVVTRDDGVNVIKEMTFDGWSASGTRLPRVNVKAGAFDGMRWTTESWDFAASVLPGTATRDRLRYVIGEVGNLSAQRITEYTHTGWRKIAGRWAYLYQGGAIGADDVTVSLGNGLSIYRLDGSGADGFDEISYQAGALATMQARDVMAEHIGIPLLATIFLAPLREFLAETGIAPAYALFLLGGTGTRKSTALALALSHFGNFTGKNLPASFNDTANFIRKKAFLLKDAPIVVDDYHPVTSLQERKKMEATAQSLARAFGDGAERGRMKADLSLQEAMPPRGVAIISGEDTPGVAESGMARFYVVPVGREDIPANDRLTQAQEIARKGALQKSMRGYIIWLLKQIETLPGMLHEGFIKNRALALQKTGDTHGRPAEAIAHMMVGYQMMLLYMRDVGAMTAEEAMLEYTHAWEVVTQNSRRQADESKEDRPSRQFLSAIAELMTSKSAGVRDLTAKQGAGGTGARDMIGYADDTYYYLLPNVTYRAVAKLFSDQGVAFPLTAKMLYKQMREDGVLTGDTMTATSATRPKWIDGKAQRVLWIARVHIDGPGAKDAAPKQLDIASFQPVDEPTPFDGE